jgi:hypothetical protein
MVNFMKQFGKWKITTDLKTVATIHITSESPLTQLECNKIFRTVGKYLDQEGFDYHLDIECDAGFDYSVGKIEK